MNRHVSTEQLSAYLDSEIGFAEVRQVEAHCSACAECGARLVSMRRVVSGLGRVERAAPPAALRQQIRRQVIAQPPAHGFRRAFDSFRLLLFPIQPALRTGVVMGLALVVGLFSLNQADSLGPMPGRPGQEVVTVLAGAQNSQVLTTSEVAGREFIWTDNGWIQRGLEGQTPVTRVDAGSPQGRALLTKYSDLEFLLADGSAVVLRYNLETVEIRNLPPSRVLGYEAPPVRRVARSHGRMVAA
jgi:anti-sigma factor RsiW